VSSAHGGSGGTASIGAGLGGNATAIVNINSFSLQQTSSASGPAGGVAQITINKNTVTPTYTNTGTLTMSGTLDLLASPISIKYGTGADPFATVKSLIISAYNSGVWTGLGIGSSIVAANSSAYGIGYADAAQTGNPAALPATTLQAKPTLLGDTQLRGSVGIGDYNTVLNNFGSGTLWTQGDFHYGGVVGIGDYNDVLNNFGLNFTGNLVIAPDLTRGLSPVLSLGTDFARSDIKLEVNTITGDVYLQTSTAVSFTGYTISNPSKNLLGGSTSPDPALLLSVKANQGGNTNIYETSTAYIYWNKISETNTELAEGQNNNGFASHTSRDDTINIPAQGTIDFGDIYNTTVNNQDISFDFTEAGATPTSGPAYYGAEVDYVGGSTPEPGSVSLLAIGAVGTLARRRRRVVI